MRCTLTQRLEEFLSLFSLEGDEFRFHLRRDDHDLRVFALGLLPDGLDEVVTLPQVPVGNVARIYYLSRGQNRGRRVI